MKTMFSKILALMFFVAATSRADEFLPVLKAMALFIPT
jgi:hypothetical protein